MNTPLFILVAAITCFIIIGCSYLLLRKKSIGCSLALASTTIVITYFVSVIIRGPSLQPAAEPLVILPNKQNFRLAEDGEFSFCLDGLARHWQKNDNGIILSSPRLVDNQPVKCLSIDDALTLLKHNNATPAQLNALRESYQ